MIFIVRARVCVCVGICTFVWPCARVHVFRVPVFSKHDVGKI